ncbi:MAG: hypothetical protein ACFNZS_11195 [Ottowia sp.]
MEMMVLRELHYSINILLRMPPARQAYLYFIRAAINGKIFAKYLLREHKSGRMHFQKRPFRQKREKARGRPISRRDAGAAPAGRLAARP